MKRLLTILMCVVMLASVTAAFAGCEEDEAPTQVSTTTTTTQSATTTTTTTQTTTTSQDEGTTTTTKEQTTTEKTNPTLPSIKPTIIPTTRPTTKPTTKPTTTTKPATESTTKPITESTTKPITESTTKPVVDEKAVFIGSWNSKFDMTAEMNEMFKDTEYEGYILFSDFSFKVTFTFKENDRYSIRVDEAAADSMYDNVKKDYEKGIRAYFADALEMNGIEMSVDEYFEYNGTTVKEFVGGIFSDDMLDEMIDAYTFDGLYEVEDGKLYVSYDLQSEVERTTYNTYKLEGNTITLYYNDTNEVDMVLTKVK